MILPKELEEAILTPLKNPLRRYLRSARVDRHVVEIVELAQYLVEFRSDPNLKGKVERLKGESFWPTLSGSAIVVAPRLSATAISSHGGSLEIGNQTLAVVRWRDCRLGPTSRTRATLTSESEM